MHYDLWDTDIAKYLGRFTDAEEVFATVRTLIDKYGPEYAECLSVGRVSSDGTVLSPITGDELLARVSVPKPEPEEEDDKTGRLIAFPGKVFRHSRALAAKATNRS